MVRPHRVTRVMVRRQVTVRRRAMEDPRTDTAEDMEDPDQVTAELQDRLTADTAADLHPPHLPTRCLTTVHSPHTRLPRPRLPNELVARVANGPAPRASLENKSVPDTKMDTTRTPSPNLNRSLNLNRNGLRTNLNPNLNNRITTPHTTNSLLRCGTSPLRPLRRTMVNRIMRTDTDMDMDSIRSTRLDRRTTCSTSLLNRRINSNGKARTITRLVPTLLRPVQGTHKDKEGREVDREGKEDRAERRCSLRTHRLTHMHRGFLRTSNNSLRLLRREVRDSMEGGISSKLDSSSRGMGRITRDMAGSSRDGSMGKDRVRDRDKEGTVKDREEEGTEVRRLNSSNNSLRLRLEGQLLPIGRLSRVQLADKDRIKSTFLRCEVVPALATPPTTLPRRAVREQEGMSRVRLQLLV